MAIVRKKRAAVKQLLAKSDSDCKMAIKSKPNATLDDEWREVRQAPIRLRRGADSTIRINIDKRLASRFSGNYWGSADKC
jgi:hypothetical protein